MDGMVSHVMSHKLTISLCVVMWLAVVIAADLNWPTHMGDQGALMEAIRGLF